MISGFRAGLSTRGLHRFKGHVERSTCRCAGWPLPGPLCFHWRRAAENYCAEVVYRKKDCKCLFFYHEFYPSPLLSSESGSLLKLNRDESERALQWKRRGLTGSFQRRGPRRGPFGCGLWGVTWIFDKGKKFL